MRHRFDGAEPEPVFELVGDELRFSLDDFNSSNSAPLSPGSVDPAYPGRRIKKYNLHDVVGIRFLFDQENAHEYFLNVTIVKKSDDYLELRVYLGVIWSAILVLMTIRGIYVCSGPVSALLFVAYLVMYARKKMNIIHEDERRAELSDMSSPSTDLDTKFQERVLLPPRLYVYAIGSWVFGASLEQFLFSRFDVEDEDTPVFLLQSVVFVFMLASCYAVHYVGTAFAAWYKKRGYLVTPPKPDATPTRTQLQKEQGTSRSVTDPKSGARPTTDGKVVKEDLDMLRKKLHFPDILKVREKHFATYLATRQKIVEWSREHHERKFGIVVLPRWGEYFLHLLPADYYNSSRLRRAIQWTLDFLLPALFIFQFLGFVYSPIVSLYKSVTQRTQTDILLNFIVRTLQWSSVRFATFCSWFVSSERLVAFVNGLHAVLSWPIFLFSKIKEPLVWVDTTLVYIRQKTLGLRTFFFRVGTILGYPLKWFDLIWTKLIDKIVAWMHGANRMGMVGLGKKFTEITSVLRRRIEVLLWDSDDGISSSSDKDGDEDDEVISLSPVRRKRSSDEGSATPNTQILGVCDECGNLVLSTEPHTSTAGSYLHVKCVAQEAVGLNNDTEQSPSPPPSNFVPKNLNLAFVGTGDDTPSITHGDGPRIETLVNEPAHLDAQLSSFCSRVVETSSENPATKRHQVRITTRFTVDCDKFVEAAPVLLTEHRQSASTPDADNTAAEGTILELVSAWRHKLAASGVELSGVGAIESVEAGPVVNLLPARDSDSAKHTPRQRTLSADEDLDSLVALGRQSTCTDGASVFSRNADGSAPSVDDTSAVDVHDFQKIGISKQNALVLGALLTRGGVKDISPIDIFRKELSTDTPTESETVELDAGAGQAAVEEVNTSLETTPDGSDTAPDGSDAPASLQHSAASSVNNNEDCDDDDRSDPPRPPLAAEDAEGDEAGDSEECKVELSVDAIDNSDSPRPEVEEDSHSLGLRQRRPQS